MFGINQNSLPSVFSHSFSRVPEANMPRSTFKRILTNKTTIDVDYLYPILNDEILPGDTYDAELTVLGRLTTPLTPFMDNLTLKVEVFAVPYRLTQDNWVRLQGERDDPSDSIDFSRPYITTTAVTGVANGTIWDYLGYPTQIPSLRIDGTLHRSYNLIINSYYRDQNWQNSLVVDKDDGPDTLTDYVLFKRNKPHDYFTSGLPDPQKGDPVSLPLGVSAPIIGLAKTNRTINDSPATNVFETTDVSGGKQVTYTSSTEIDNGSANRRMVIKQDANGNPQIFADLANAVAPTVYELYEAFALQELLQIDARGGTRYFEILRAHFGVTSPDSRLQRPEYLGGTSFNINISPLPQTSATSGGSELGQLAAIGQVTGTLRFFKSFVEHSDLLVIASVVSDLTYQQGLHRSHSRRTRYDFYMPALANLGEQAVLLKEIYAQGTNDDEDVLCYQERWSELRFGKNMITGKMRSNDAQSLDLWHLSEEFSTPPTLETLLPCNTPIDRVLAVANEPDIRLDCYMVVNHSRVMPTYSVPMLNNRF